MKNHPILAISALAILSSSMVPMAYADSAGTEATANAEIKAKENSTGDFTTDAKKAWKDIKQDTKQAYENIKAFVISEKEGVTGQETTIERRSSASGMIGSPVYNEKKERVGTVKDIIVNSDGKANMLVIADGEFPGYDGKLVAFDFTSVVQNDEKGDFMIPLSETVIDSVAEFSYEPKTEKSLVRAIPEGGYSVAKLLDGKLLNDKNETVGNIDDIYFQGGAAKMVVVGFDKVLGLGGKHAAMSYNLMSLVYNGNELNLQLSPSQAAMLESYKKSTDK